jgi:hypothetical protein
MHKEHAAEPATHAELAVGKQQAIIVRAEEMFGNIRIRCPVDLTEHEVLVGTKEFICPIGQEVLLIGV